MTGAQCYFKVSTKWTCYVILLLIMQALFLPSLAGAGTNETESMNDSNPRQGQRQGLKDITFYMHNSTNARYIFDYSTTHVFNTSIGNKTNLIWDQQRVRMNWFLHPTLASDFRVNGDITMVVYLNTQGVSANPNLYCDIYEVTYKNAGSETSTLIKGGSDSATVTSGIDSYQITISDVEHTFSSGSSIRIYLEVQGGASAWFGIWYGNSSFDSRITFQAYDYLEIAELKTRDHTDSEKTNFEIDVSNKIVKMQANVTDPMGGYDINLVKLTLVDPNSNTILDNVTMKKIAGSPISFANLFEVWWNYTAAPIGEYQYTVWAVDNNGYYYYYHKENFNFGNYPEVKKGSFFVGGLPRVGLVKVLDKGENQMPLEGALVQVKKANSVIYSNVTNSTGEVGINTFQGTYDISVEWQGVEVGNQINYFVNDDFELTISCNVFYPQFKVVDNSSNPLEGANIYLGHPNGTFLVRPFTTDGNGTFYLDKAPIGDYELIVKWRDVEVADEVYFVNQNGLIATIIAKVFKVNLKFVDSRLNGLGGIHIIFADSVSRLILDSKLSNLNGEIDTQLPAGDYNITVYWQQRVIQQFELTISGKLTKTIHCWVYYVNLVAVDPAPHNESVENARVLLTAPESGGLFDSQLTGSDGKLETRLPAGDVNVNVYWKSSLVNSTQLDITDDVDAEQPINLICDIYYLTLTAVDSRDKPVEDAQIKITYSLTTELVDSQVAGDSGTIISRLPKENYDISVRWLDTEVYLEENKTLDQDEDHDLKCDIYYLLLSAVDSKKKPVENAQITIMFSTSQEVVDSQVTNETGIIRTRLPKEVYDIRVRWYDTEVYSETGKILNSDLDYELDCWVYYLDIKLHDSKNKTLANAQIAVTMVNQNKVIASGSSDLNGTMEVRLPIGSYDINVTWEGVMVKSMSDYYIDYDKALVLNCNVYYFTVKAVDSELVPLENAQIKLVFSSNDKVFNSMVTDIDGTMESRIPIGDYDISVIWKDIEVFFEAAHTVNTNDDYTLNSWVYYLRIKAVGNDGEPLKDVSVTVKDLEEVNLENIYTNKNGNVEFRLPFNNYIVKARYQTTYYYKIIDMSVDKNVDLTNGTSDLTLTFSGYPPAFTSTPLFGIIVGVIIFIIILLLLWLLVIRKLQKKLDEAEEGESEPSGRGRVEEPKKEEDSDDEFADDGFEYSKSKSGADRSEGSETSVPSDGSKLEVESDPVSDDDLDLDLEIDSELDEIEKLNDDL